MGVGWDKDGLPTWTPPEHLKEELTQRDEIVRRIQQRMLLVLDVIDRDIPFGSEMQEEDFHGLAMEELVNLASALSSLNRY